MWTVVPFTNLRDATYRAVVREDPHAQFVYTGFSDHAYWQLLDTYWRFGESFTVIEHDVVPPEGWFASLSECPEPWCAYEYDCGGQAMTALGATRFSATLLARREGLVSGLSERYRHWDGLDAVVIGQLHRDGEHEHVHEGMADHLREPWRMRRSRLVKLRYTGDGTRYLNGVPAADHEPADEQAAAEALASGLYEVVEEAPRKKGGKAADVSAADSPAPVEETVAPAEA